MRIRLAVPDELNDQDRKAALDAALESVTRTNTGLIRSGVVPPAAGQIKTGRVVWRPEPPGDEHFDLPQTVLARGWGDCDDLAPWHAASLRASGADPGARAIVKKSGDKRWHAVTQRSDGSIEDASAHAGMHEYQRAHGVSGVGESFALVGSAGAIHQPMSADGRMCLAVCPSRDPRHPRVFFVRCDVPDGVEPWDWSSMAAHPHPGKAVLQAVKTVRRVAGDDIDPEDDARLAAVNDLVLGVDPDDVADALAEVMGEEIDVEGCMDDAVHSVGFFGDLLKAVASPITSVAKFVQHPSLSNAGHIFTDPLTSHLNLAKQAMHVPGLGTVLRAGIPLAAGAFGGPFGAAGGEMLARYLASQGGAPRPVPRPMPQGMPQGLPPELAQLAQQMPSGFQQLAPLAARFMFPPGNVTRPWGAAGPAVMRF